MFQKSDINNQKFGRILDSLYAKLILDDSHSPHTLSDYIRLRKHGKNVSMASRADVLSEAGTRDEPLRTRTSGREDIFSIALIALQPLLVRATRLCLRTG